MTDYLKQQLRQEYQTLLDTQEFESDPEDFVGNKELKEFEKIEQEELHITL